MLNEIVFANTVFFEGIKDVSNRIKLMISGENEHFIFSFFNCATGLIIVLLCDLLNMEIVLDEKK